MTEDFMNSDNSVNPQARLYALGRNDAETRRLRMQSALYADATRTLLLRAGLRAGLDVLDVGCGAGDVALAVADIVGPRGTVTAVDNDAQILKVARKRAAAAGVHNVTFTVGDVGDLATDARFDAVVGRLILMHVADPTATLARLATLLRPGGTMTIRGEPVGFVEGVDVGACGVDDAVRGAACGDLGGNGGDARGGDRLDWCAWQARVSLSVVGDRVASVDCVDCVGRVMG